MDFLYAFLVLIAYGIYESFDKDVVESVKKKTDNWMETQDKDARIWEVDDPMEGMTASEKKTVVIQGLLGFLFFFFLIRGFIS